MIVVYTKKIKALANAINMQKYFISFQNIYSLYKLCIWKKKNTIIFSSSLSFKLYYIVLLLLVRVIRIHYSELFTVNFLAHLKQGSKKYFCYY